MRALNRSADVTNAFARIVVSPYAAGRHTQGESRIAGMAPLLDHLMPTLRAIARAYLGPDAAFGGYTVLRLFGRDLSEHEYLSGNWHHDRCGRRLKCFVYLQTTTKNHHPPRIAPGTHRTLWYSYDNLHESRFAAAYVEREYAVVDILGDFGEGFCFDTNAIHKGTLGGTHRRDAIIFEFHDQRKVRRMYDENVSAPCSS